ncbi:FAD-linked oxidoreductase sthB [Fulvia fulva]|nr:FAD-linked oxidoreductase sthB [Fulvia fulva]
MSSTGPAVKLGAGVTGSEAELEVGNAGYRIVTGDCPTVGVAGGYTQVGGHSMLNSAYGVAADNVLEWEVVTADGQHLIAPQTENADLYWAISGGGGGTFGVTLSMTTKIHADNTIVSGATLGIVRTLAPNEESLAAAVQAWWQFLPSIFDTGAVPLFNIGPLGFNVSSVTAPNRTSDEVAAIFEPYLTQLRDLNITFDFAPKQWSTYFEHYEDIQGPLPNGIYVASMLSTLEMLSRKAYLADSITPLIEAVTCDSGAYLNEADPLVYPADQPEKWQNAFHGSHYPRLREIKDIYVPEGVFYANTAVGVEDWSIDGEGRLCRA